MANPNPRLRKPMDADSVQPKIRRKASDAFRPVDQSLPPVKNYVPSEKDRDFITAMRGAGISEQQICWVLNVTDDTLQRYFGKVGDDEDARAMVKGRLVGNLFRQAMKDDFKAIPAIIFYLRSQFGWSSKDRDDMPITIDENGMPVAVGGQEIHVVIRRSPDETSPDDLEPLNSVPTVTLR